MSVLILQLTKLLEMYECHMIGEIRKKIGKELSVVTAERVREDSNEPTDIWKKPVSPITRVFCIMVTWLLFIYFIVQSIPIKWEKKWKIR